ncbi:MAG: carotenoid 1,2-hydratase [Myxococcota bacterium]
MIVFLGSVFSPYAAARRRRGQRPDPVDHAAVNVALDWGGLRRWTFTERGRRNVVRSASALSIGPSRIERAGHALEIELAELTVPVPRRVRGRIRLAFEGGSGPIVALDEGRRHFWSALSPCARIEIELDVPRIAWHGRAYVDTNWGERPLESDFRSWHWSRTELADGRTAVFYDPVPLVGAVCSRALVFDRAGRLDGIEAPPLRPLPRSPWGVERSVRSAGEARVVRTLEDSPFYARSLVETAIDGDRGVGIHESLDLGRFARPWVQRLLPFRAPRRA